MAYLSTNSRYLYFEYFPFIQLIIKVFVTLEISGSGISKFGDFECFC